MTTAQILGALLMLYAFYIGVRDALDGEEVHPACVAILIVGAILIAGGDA